MHMVKIKATAATQILYFLTFDTPRNKVRLEQFLFALEDFSYAFIDIILRHLHLT